jgi:hypothetical protein
LLSSVFEPTGVTAKARSAHIHLALPRHELNTTSLTDASNEGTTTGTLLAHRILTSLTGRMRVRSGQRVPARWPFRVPELSHISAGFGATT